MEAATPPADAPSGKMDTRTPKGDFKLGALVASLFVLLIACSGCYLIRPSNGAGQTRFSGTRKVEPSSVAVDPGFRIEAVATGLTFPTGVTFDDRNNPCVVESGYAYGEKWTKPRLLRIEGNGQITEIAGGGRNGPWTGVTFDNGNFYIAEGGELEGGRILRISADGKTTTLISNLPSFGDHHTDGPVMGPDGWLYFGQGTASNAGIVGEDNAKFGWLKRHPEFHDIPGQDVVLAGRNVTTKDFIGNRGKVQTGAYLPFGTPSTPGETIKGQTVCSGSVLRIRPDGGEPQLVAWGLRNPFGLAFLGDRLFVTDNGYDERGSRPVWGAPDFLWSIDKGAWYGWPDFCGGIPVTDKRFKTKGGFVIQNHPSRPPRPVATFAVHSSADGFDFSRNAAFGFPGQAFVALFGDEAPAVGKVLDPVGAKVVRVNIENGLIEDFAVNKGKKNGPGSRVGGGGLERPVAARFNAAGDALYVVDFGIMTHDKKGAHPVPGSGVLWRIGSSGTPTMTGRLR
jgi:glucose/arabinose dehydrogenase